MKKNVEEKQTEGRNPIQYSVCKCGFYVVKLRLQNTRIFKIGVFEEKGPKMCTSIFIHKTFYHEKNEILVIENKANRKKCQAN